VVEPGDRRARSQRVAQQQTAAAAEIEQLVRALERERVEDRAARGACVWRRRR
jgi:hypothetical protein